MLGSLEPIVQKDVADCGIAALAMALGRPYREVSDVARSLVIKPHGRGMHTTETLRVAEHFGAAFRRCQYSEDVTGLLSVKRGRGKKRQDHFTALFQGVVINPADGLVWDIDTYLEQGGWSVVAFWERVK